MPTMLALDPGNRETGWCIVDTITRAPVQGGKDENTLVSGIVSGGAFTVAAIEIIESYGMATCSRPASGSGAISSCSTTAAYRTTSSRAKRKSSISAAALARTIPPSATR